jgi:glycosyltransferase involved in cell wall biosynthesis
MISILLATTGRPDMAERCVRSIMDTAPDADVEIVAAVDACSATLWRLHDLGCVVDWDKEYRGWSQAWNDALSLAKGDKLVLAGDDLVFEPGWLEAALACLEGFDGGWGLVGFNDGHFTGTNPFSTHYLMSRKLVVEVFGGVVAWPHYRHSFNDLEACERAKRAGRYAWCEGARVRHEHWLFGDRPQDGTDTRNLPDHPASERIYRERAMAGFPNDFDPAITE